MKSGIYKLKFDCGDFYIGKSVNIEERYKQHCDKMAEGKAAASVQSAYERSGNKYPIMSMIFDCHKDYLDVMEAYYINLYSGHGMLNTNIPPWPFEISDYVDLRSYLLSHVKTSLIDNVKSYNETIATAEECIKDLNRLKQDANVRKLEELDAQNKMLMNRLSELEEINYRYSIELAEKLPWWKKIFA